MTASSSPAHTSPEMLPAPLWSPHGVPPATQPAGRRGCPSSWRPFPWQHGFPRRRSSLPRPGATTASRSGPRASQRPPHSWRHPTGSRQRPGDASVGDRIGKSERVGLGAATTSADGSVSRLLGSDGEYSPVCGSSKKEPLDSFWRAEIQKMSHCDMPTLCHPI